MADPALERLRARLDRFHDTGDPAEVIGDDVLRELSSFAAKPDISGDMTALELVAWLYWYRSLALPAGGGAREREAATKLFEIIYISDPEAVPGPLRQVLRDRRLAKQADFARQSPLQSPGLDVPLALRHATEQFQRFHLTGDRATLEDSIAQFRRLRSAMAAAHMLRPLVDVILGLALSLLYQQASSPDILAECVTGIAGLPAGHEMRPAALMSLVGALQLRQLERPEPAVQAELADLLRQANESVTADSPLGGLIAMAGGLVTTMDPANAGDPGGIDSAIDAARQILAHTPPGNPSRPHAVLNLGAALAARFQVTRLAGTLDESITLLREADAAMPAGDPQHPALRGLLGAALAEVSRIQGDPALGAEAVGLLRQGLATTTPDHPLYPVFLGNFAVGLWQRYTQSGERGDLEEAIETGRTAVDLVPRDSPVFAAILHNLSAPLTDLHRQTGHLAALRESVERSREAARTVDAGSSEHRHAMLGLTVGLILLHRRTGDRTAAHEAVTWGRRALEGIAKDHPERLAYSVGLAQALQAAADDDPADLQEAIDLLRGDAHAVALRQHAAYDLQYVANALGSALLAHAHATKDLAATDEAIGWLRRATAEEPPSPHRDRCLGLLGKALQLRSELAHDRGALAEALSAFGAAASTDVSPTMRVLRNVEVGRTAAALRDWPLALDGFAVAVGGLCQVAQRRLDRADQEFGLTMLSGTAAEAAACALNANQPELAAELLEQGRGVLLAQALEMTGDLDELADRDPERAARLAAVRDQLDALCRPGPSPAAEPDNPSAVGRRAERRSRLAAEWDEIVAEVRRTGSESFLRPATFAELAEQTNEGPIVLLNVSRYRSDAILLTSGGLELLPLEAPEGFLAAAQARAMAFTDAVRHVDDQDQAFAARSQSHVTDTLGWLWDTVAAPVLDRLGLLELPTSGARMTRVWWCAGGPLALLPLHAAGRDGTAVIDRVVSSYTPTVRALRHARGRHRAAIDPAARMLVVAMSRTPGYEPLSRVADEMRWLRQTFDAEKLLNDEATRDRILTALPGYPIVHFACHGVTDLDLPSASALLCHDYREHPLTVAHLSRLNLDNGALAYLSACSTARTSHELADEAVHLATAFQLAGYAQVVGTLWNVGDATSSDVARRVYEVACSEDGRKRSVAYALHEAVHAIRPDAEHDAIWSPYVHVGV